MWQFEKGPKTRISNIKGGKKKQQSQTTEHNTAQTQTQKSEVLSHINTVHQIGQKHHHNIRTKQLKLSFLTHYCLCFIPFHSHFHSFPTLQFSAFIPIFSFSPQLSFSSLFLQGNFLLSSCLV